MSKKVVFITGGIQELGRQMALEFARCSYDLGISARREAVLNELREETLTFAQVEVRIYSLDAYDVSAVQATLPKVHDDFGRLDIVIANAGLVKESPVEYGDFNNVKAMVDLNVTETFATIDSAVRIFHEQGFGHMGASSTYAVGTRL
jgi:short-subunit dehydrogenase